MDELEIQFPDKGTVIGVKALFQLPDIQVLLKQVNEQKVKDRTLDETHFGLKAANSQRTRGLEKCIELFLRDLDGAAASEVDDLIPALSFQHAAQFIEINEFVSQFYTPFLAVERQIAYRIMLVLLLLPLVDIVTEVIATGNGFENKTDPEILLQKYQRRMHRGFVAQVG